MTAGGLLPPFWEPVGFTERFGAWRDQEHPDVELARIVSSWIVRQIGEPYAGVRRETDVLPNLWSARIPGTERNGTDVFCSYLIYDERRQIRCDQIATLSRP